MPFAPSIAIQMLYNRSTSGLSAQCAGLFRDVVTDFRYNCVFVVFLSISLLLLALVAAEVPNPARAGSGQPFLAAGRDGAVYMSWVEPAGSGHRMQAAVREGGAWRPPGTVAEGSNWFVNWADYPVLLPFGAVSMAAHWLERTGASKHSYTIHLAISGSREAPWRIVFSPTVKQEGQYNGFVSMVATPAGFGAAYLAPAPGGGEHGKALRFAEFSAGGAVLSDSDVDGDVCSCCQTATAMTAQGPIIAYRDHEKGEIRDISIVRRRGGKWTAPRPVHRDGWEINACPVNGPALAASGKRVAVAWFTGAHDKPRVSAAFSDDSGESFSPAVPIDGGSPAGRVAVLLLDDGSAMVSWLERIPAGGAEIRLRRVYAGGKPGEARAVAAVDAARKTGFPQMIATNGKLLIAWTADRVRTAEIAIGN